MEVKEDDENFLNTVDYMFKGLENASRIALLSSNTKNTSWPAARPQKAF